MTACLDDNDLVEHAEGLTGGARAAAITRHLDACERCRRLLAELVRSDLPKTRDAREATPGDEDASRPLAVTAAAAAPGPDALPAQLVRDNLRADAPHRESIVARVWAGLALSSVLLVTLSMPPGGEEFVRRAMLIQSGLFVYGVAMYLALRRGLYHPAIPFVATVAEMSMFFAMIWTAMHTMGPESLQRSPALPLVGAAVVFSAIRADPRVSLLAGATAAVAWFVLFRQMLGMLPAEELARVPADLAWFGGTFYLLAGIGGAVLARYLVHRAEAALRAVREQDLFGKYILHEPVGRGGMGEVVRATYCPEGGFSKTVAVKRIRADIAEQPERIDAFREEAKLSAQLAHPNIVTVFDFGRFRGSYMVAMEFVDGIPLSTLLRRLGPLSPAAVAYLGTELAAGLAYLHTRRGEDGAPLGLVHCDVNPPNVLVSRIGEVKLTDFGVARAEAAVDPTDARTFAGKVPYAAPEQLRGEPLDGRADLYALGLTLHEALTGGPVFPHSRGRATRPSVPRPSLAAPGTPRALDALVLDLLHDDRDARPPDAEAVRARLLALSGDAAPYPTGATLLADAVDRARSASPA